MKEEERHIDTDTPVIPKPSKADGDVLGLRSIQFRMWLSFVMLTAITLIILWVAQILFYTASFNDMAKSEVKHSGDELSGEIQMPNFNERFRDRAIGGGYSALLIDVETAEPKMYANANGSVSTDSLDIDLFNSIIGKGADFLNKVDSASGSVVYTHSVDGYGNYIVYGNRVQKGGRGYYMCIVKPLARLDASVGILRNQLVIVTIICMFVSMVLALTFSKTISRPITKFSSVARKLGKGDFSVRFEGNGWTEIDELADTLNYATEEMGKTETMRRDFFANVSHDLRTPLTMVRAYAEMIRDISGEDKDKREKHAQIIMDEADRLSSLVGDILDLTKLQAGTDEQHIEKTDIALLAAAVVARFDAMSEKNGFTFESEIDCASCAMCDKKRIEQVLYNLIGNAMNYSKDVKLVTVRVKEKNKTVRVEVSDRGKGIPESERDAVWERYYRSNQTKRVTVGTGIGLAIVKNILVRHNAAYGVDSTVEDNPEGKPSGTTFWFELEKYVEPLPQPPVDKKRRKKEDR